MGASRDEKLGKEKLCSNLVVPKLYVLLWLHSVMGLALERNVLL